MISPVIKYQSVLKSVYLPFKKVNPYYYKLALESRINQPVFRVVQMKIPIVMCHAKNVSVLDPT